jgi:hypothetical protein
MGKFEQSPPDLKKCSPEHYPTAWKLASNPRRKSSSERRVADLTFARSDVLALSSAPVSLFSPAVLARVTANRVRSAVRPR